jgi:hypothetical protein
MVQDVSCFVSSATALMCVCFRGEDPIICGCVFFLSSSKCASYDVCNYYAQIVGFET